MKTLIIKGKTVGCDEERHIFIPINRILWWDDERIEIKGGTTVFNEDEDFEDGFDIEEEIGKILTY